MATGPLSDPQHQDRLRIMERARERQHENDLERLMNETWGRRLAYWLIYELGSLQSNAFAFDMKHATAEHTAYRCGRQEPARRLQGELQDIAPRQWIEMLDEQNLERIAGLALEQRDEPTGDNLE